MKKKPDISNQIKEEGGGDSLEYGFDYWMVSKENRQTICVT